MHEFLQIRKTQFCLNEAMRVLKYKNASIIQNQLASLMLVFFLKKINLLFHWSQHTSNQPSHLRIRLYLEQISGRNL